MLRRARLWYWLILAGIPALAITVALVDRAVGAKHQCAQRGGHLEAFDCAPAVTHCSTGARGQRACETSQRCDWRCVDDRPRPPTLAADAGMP